jgi:type 1 glutamine amidotransferase
VLPGAHALLETDHATSDRVIGWAHRFGKSRVVYLQPGHGPQAFSHPIFETLVHRSLLWTAGMLEPKK